MTRDTALSLTILTLCAGVLAYHFRDRSVETPRIQSSKMLGDPLERVPGASERALSDEPGLQIRQLKPKKSNCAEGDPMCAD